MIDVILTIDAFFTAYYVRNRFFAGQYGVIRDFDGYLWILMVVIPLWPVLFYIFNLYNVACKENYIITFLKAVFAVCGGTVALAALMFFGKEQMMSRLFFILFAAADLSLILLFRIFVRITLYFYRKSKKGRLRVLIVGTNSLAERFAEYINENPQLMIEIIGYLRAGDTVHSKRLNILGAIGDLSEVLVKNVVDEVIFALPRDYQGVVEPYVLECKKMGITVNMLADLFDFTVSKVKIDTIGALPVITFHTVPFDTWQLFLKRTMDIIGALIGLAITAAVFLFVAPAILLESPGPVFFSQNRVGRNGRIFKCYKFRSMYIDAEERKKELVQYNQMKGAIFKIKDDPRITRTGRFIRAASIDELPQFWNVLKGDMSLVGTRPPTLDEVESYETYHWKRLSIKPGITGMWQVSGRNRVEDFEDIVRMDTNYIDDWSLWVDIKLIFKTVQTVLVRNGAY